MLCLSQEYRRRGSLAFSVIGFLILMSSTVSRAQEGTAQEQLDDRRISVSEYREKVKAGWIGQMAGVGWGFPTEFRWLGEIIPADKVPEWEPEMVNVFDQDDLYVEMTFLRTLEEYGFDVPIKQAGIDFANSKYTLWVANREGRTNLRRGIAPPDSWHPAFNLAAVAIDYQIEADYSGLIAPGMPNIPIELGEKFGRLMNYGDGLYGGQFIGAMYAEAFFESDPAIIVAKGLRAIPEGSQYAEAVRDVIEWHSQYPDNWEKTWHLVNDKYHLNPEYRQFTADPLIGGVDGPFNIDAKLNGAYVVMGLLYGEGDVDKTIEIAMRGGQDSDCNPSNAAGILLTAQGYDAVPEKFTSALDLHTKFDFTEYTFTELIDVNEKLARQAVLRSGGRIEHNTQGEEEFVIPVVNVKPSPLEQSHAAGEITGSTFTDDEWSRIEGSTWFRYALAGLLIIALVAVKENQNLQALAIGIPLLVLLGLTTLLSTVISPDLAASLDIVTILQSLTVALVLALLMQPLVAAQGWLMILGAAIGVFLITGYVGTLGAQEGRVTAAFQANFTSFRWLAAFFLLAVAVAAVLSQRRYTRLRFSVTFAFTYLVICVVGMSLVLLFIVDTKGPFGAFVSLPAILAISAMLTIVNCLILWPFMVLSHKNGVFDERIRGWLKAGVTAQS
ncbi:MAG: ADP-ribosylglycohydrolase family protein [Pseudomonadota bacterium]